MSNSKILSKKTAFLKTSVFSKFTQLSKKYKSVNFGQGFPDWEVPDFVQESAIEAIKSGFISNQYTSNIGFPKLTSVLSNFYKDLFKRKTINESSEILITNGATQALYLAIQALVSEGDEVICFEPFFDTYPIDVKLANGKPIYIALKFPSTNCKSSQEQHIDFDELEANITEKTRLIILNNPHNPTGKMFSTDELNRLSKIVLNHKNLYVLSDEVYEFITFDKLKHVRLASLNEEIWNRTITVSSAGKTFSCTGQKIGQAIGPSHLIKPIQLLQQYIPFCVTTPLQHAVALAFTKAMENEYFVELKKSFQEKRDLMCQLLLQCGINPIIPQSGYFVLGNTEKFSLENNILSKEEDNDVHKDFLFAENLTKKIGVTTIPPSAFYSEDHHHVIKNYSRFAFCKTNDVIKEGCEILIAKSQSNKKI